MGFDARVHIVECQPERLSGARIEDQKRLLDLSVLLDV